MQFVATGQTGMMIAGNGIPLDRVIGDFMSGAIESAVLEAAENHEVVLVEGQGGLLHPAYSGVTLALIHGSLAERGPDKPWIIAVSNEGPTPAVLVADTRLLWLEVQVPGFPLRSATVGCPSICCRRMPNLASISDWFPANPWRS